MNLVIPLKETIGDGVFAGSFQPIPSKKKDKWPKPRDISPPHPACRAQVAVPATGAVRAALRLPKPGLRVPAFLSS